MTAADRPSVTPRVGDTLTTAEQLDALPDKAVVLDEHVEPWQKLGEGLWCGSAGGPMSGSALLRTRTDEVTVLYVPGEQPGRSTDQALAEAWDEGHRTGWEHCQDGNYGNDHWDDPTPNPYAAAARAETTTAHECDSGDFDRTICDCGAMHSYCTICGTRQDDCPHGTTTATPPGLTVSEDGSVLNWQGVNYVPQRAETTTATVEDAARAIAAWALDFAGLGVGIYLNGETIGDPNGPWDVPTDAADSLAAWLNQRGLLATARTRPTREQIAEHLRKRANDDEDHADRLDTEDAALTIRYATLDDGTVELDEVVALNATVHLEKMDTASWWLGIDANGEHLAVILGVDEDGNEFAHAEPETGKVRVVLDGKQIASLDPPGLVTSRPFATARTHPAEGEATDLNEDDDR